MGSTKPEIADTQVFRFDQSGALLRQVMETAAVGMALLGMAGRVIYANRAFSDLLGYPGDECIGLTVQDLVVPEEATTVRLHIDRLTRAETQNYRAETRFVRSDGSAAWVMVSASMLPSERTGRPLYTILQITSLDRLKRAEAALAASDSRWSFALEAAGQGVWDSDLRTNIVFYSRMWRLMRGFGPDEEVDSAIDSWMERVHPDDRERILAIVHRQNTGELGYNAFEYRERHRDGHYIWILSRGRAVEWLPDGSPIRMIGTDTDITSLKLVEGQLAAEKERLRVTLQSIGDGVISTDAEGRVTFMNTVAEEMTGWPASEATSRPIEDVFAILDDATQKPAANPVMQSMARQKLYHLDKDVVLLSRDGQRRDIRHSAAPVRTPEGALIGAVLVFQDITHSRALQRELAHSATHDGLTGLPNRSAFERALSEACTIARRTGREHALCFLDLDRFKSVNDGAGHAAGDALLQLVGQVIKYNCRSKDFAARIGGDEFVLLLPNCSTAGATSVAQKLVDAIGALQFAWQGKVYEIGASVGITAVTRAPKSAVTLMAEADAACYAAKAGGRSQVAVYNGGGAATPDQRRA